MMAASRKMLLQGLLVVATIFVPSKTPYAGTCYWDRSAPNNRGLLYSGSTQPMSVSVFDFNGPQGRGDGVLDVQIHFRFGPARLYRGQVNSGSCPEVC